MMRRMLYMLCFCLLTAAGGGGGRAQAPARRPQPVQTFLLPTVQFGSYNLCLVRRPGRSESAVFRPAALRAEFRDEGTRKTTTATVTLLPAPLPIPEYGPLDRVPGRVWLGLRWDTSGLPPGLYTLTVNVLADTGQGLSLPTKPASLPIYLPDPNGLQTARAAFLGKRVWPCPKLHWTGPNGASFEFDASLSLRVRSITRLNQPYADLAMNGGRGPGVDLSNADFVTCNPLRVTFDEPHRLHRAAYSVINGKPASPGPVLTQDFTDPWQMERALSFKPLPRRLLKLRPGVSSPEQVLAAHGWPTDYGSLTQLKTRPEWRCVNLKPFYATVYFAHGKFARFDPGGQMP